MSYVKLPKISYSGKAAYDWCPRQWKYIYLDKVSPDKPVYPTTVTGTAVHSLVSQMYRDQIFTLPFLLINWQKHLEAAIKEHKYPATAMQIMAMQKMGIEIIQNFYRMAEREGILIAPVKTEWRFKLSLDDFAISGVVDLIVIVRGQVYIIDFKTGLNDLTQQEVDENEQLTFYALAALKLLGIDNAKVGFFYPRLGAIKYSKRDTANYTKLIEDARVVLGKIAARQFTPTYVKCNWCRFANRCAAEDMAAKTKLDMAWFYTEPRRT